MTITPTQADRDAAAEIWNKLGMSWRGERLSTGGYDDNTFIQSFARHREAAFEAGRKAERAAVVAWLREHAPQWGHEALADAIERGEMG